MLRSLRTFAATAAAIAACAVVSLASMDAEAYCRSTTCVGVCGRDASPDGCKTEGTKLQWPTSCVGFSMQKDASIHIDMETARAVMQAGVVAWSDIECADGGYATIAFAQAADVSCNVAEYNVDGANANIIIFQDNRWGYTSEDNTLAKTTVTYDTDTGEIFDADIEFNHAFNEFTVAELDIEYDLQSIATHEFGHFIGLDHTDDFLATMNAGYTRGTIDLRTLEPDDEDAACAAYPSSRNAACATNPKGGFTPECAGVVPDEEDDEGCSIAAKGPGDERQTPTRHGNWALMMAAAAFVAFRRRSHTNLNRKTVSLHRKER
jgi:hypothetical protein